MNPRVISPRRAVLAVIAAAMLGLQASRFAPPGRFDTYGSEAAIIVVAMVAALVLIWSVSPEADAEDDTEE